MHDDVRARLRDELAGHPEPPLGSLVLDSLQQGRRLRTVGRLYRAGAAGATAGLVVGAVLGAQSLTRSSAPSPIPPAATPVSTAKPSSTATLPATDQALLLVLLDDLPSGRTSHQGTPPAPGPNAPNAPHAPANAVQTWLDTGAGPGVIELSLTTSKAVTAYSHLLTGSHLGSSHSHRLADGDRVTVLTNSTDCLQARSITVERRDGTVLKLDLASCLPENSALHPGRIALTDDQAVTIAEDPRLAARMPADLVRRGATRFPRLS